MSYDFNDPTISDLEFAKRLTEAFDEEMEGVNPEDFEVNPTQKA